MTEEHTDDTGTTGVKVMVIDDSKTTKDDLLSAIRRYVGNEARTDKA
jgi:hypothetical protein